MFVVRMKLFALVASVATVGVAVAAPVPAQAPPQDSEWAPVVKTLTGEDLPVALRLSTMTSHLDKMVLTAGHRAAKYFLGARGLELEDSELELLHELYGDFDEDQGVRDAAMLRKFQGQATVIERKSRRFVLERYSFTGGVLGAWLAKLRAAGYDTDGFLRKAATSYYPSAFWGGGPPTMEALNQESSLFEQSFAKEYGKPLQAVLDADGQGGAQ
jgi:hypothetical protein